MLAQGWQVAIVDALSLRRDLCAQRVRSEEDPSLGREIIGSAQLMRGKGIDDTALSINWSDLMRHRRGFTDPLPQNLERDLANRSRHRC